MTEKYNEEMIIAKAMIHLTILCILLNFFDTY